MKRYLFNQESGVYAGETFDERSKINHEEGMTAIAPPDYAHGQVPVFDRQMNSWAVIPVNIARQLLNIKTSVSTENRS
jgi:hypothetical protein